MPSPQQTLLKALKIEAIAGLILSIPVVFYIFAWTQYLGTTPTKEELLGATMLSAIVIAVLFGAPLLVKWVLPKNRIVAGTLLGLWSLLLLGTYILCPVAIYNIYMFFRTLREKVEPDGSGNVG